MLAASFKLVADQSRRSFCYMLAQVTQEVRVGEEYDKKRILYEVLEKVMEGSKVLIFTSTKRTADDLTASLRQDGWPARAIHGDKSAHHRITPLHSKMDCASSACSVLAASSRNVTDSSRRSCCYAAQVPE